MALSRSVIGQSSAQITILPNQPKLALRFSLSPSKRAPINSALTAPSLPYSPSPTPSLPLTSSSHNVYIIMASTHPLHSLKPHQLKAMLHPPHHRHHRRHRHHPPPPHYFRLARPSSPPDSPPYSPDSLSGTSSFSRIERLATPRWRNADELDDLRLPESAFRRRMETPGLTFQEPKTFTLKRANVQGGAAWLQVFDDATGAKILSAHGRVGLDVDIYDASGNLLVSLASNRRGEVMAKNRLGQVMMTAVTVGDDKGWRDADNWPKDNFGDDSEDGLEGLDGLEGGPEPGYERMMRRRAERFRTPDRFRTPVGMQRARRRSMSRDRGRARARARSLSRERVGGLGFPERPPFADRPPFMDRPPFVEHPPFPEHVPFGERGAFADLPPFAERPGFQERPSFAERRPHSDRSRGRSASRERGRSRSSSASRRNQPVHHWPQANGYDQGQSYAQSQGAQNGQQGQEQSWKNVQGYVFENVGNHTHARRQFTSTGQVDPDYFQRLHYYNSPLLNEPYSDMLTAQAGRRMAEAMRGQNGMNGTTETSGMAQGMGGSSTVVVAEFWRKRGQWFKLVRAVEGGKEAFVMDGVEMGVLMTKEGGALGLTLGVGCDLAVVVAAVVCGMWLAAVGRT